MKLTPLKNIDQKAFITFFIEFFELWKNDEKADGEKIQNKQYMDILPKNVMWEIKPLALMQFKKIKTASENVEPGKFEEILTEFLEDICFELWEKTPEECNIQQIPLYMFCQSIILGIVKPQNIFGTTSRYLLGAATSALKINPDPQKA